MNEYLDFIHTGPSRSGKTHTWEVRARRTGALLGRIRWHGPWRQYCFFPTCSTNLANGFSELVSGTQLRRPSCSA